MLAVLANAIKHERELKGTHIGKEEMLLSLFTDDIIIYVENQKELTKKVMKLLCDCRRIATYKVNIQKSVSHFPIHQQ